MCKKTWKREKKLKKHVDGRSPLGLDDRITQNTQSFRNKN